MNCIIYHEVKKGTACPDGIMAAAIANMEPELWGMFFT
jgi:hypothetical protein